MNKFTKRLVAVAAFGGYGYALSCLSVGCGAAEYPKEFVIPRSLVTRMLDAHDRARDGGKDGGACFDAAEMVSLAVGHKMTNAQEIALLFTLVLVVPHPDHSLAEALGR